MGPPGVSRLEVHASPQASAPVIEKLGLLFVYIMPEAASGPPSYTPIATPSGKTGYVSIDSIAPIGNDQICYVKAAAPGRSVAISAAASRSSTLAS